jgi:hypothetical protein
VQHVLQHGKQIEDFVGGIVTVARAAAAAKPVSRFSSTVSSGKISRPCGTKADAARARS